MPARFRIARLRCIWRLLAVGVGPGDEVITASHSFIATANSIRYCGATPVFVDIDPRTYNIDPQRVAEAVTGRTRAILAVHQMGMPCDLPALMAVASRHDIALDRRRRLRCGKRNSDEWTMGADWQASRTNCVLFLSPAQSHHDRRGRHADDVRSGIRPDIQAVPPARHERPGYRAARLASR